MGSAPYLGGGFGHFYAYAPIKIEYCIDRYAMEVKRQLDVLDRHLADKQYMCGDEYTIADIAIWPWYGLLMLDGIYKASEFLSTASYVHLNRWARDVNKRPAVQRGQMVNRTWGAVEGQLHERHDASDFEDRSEGKLEVWSFLMTDKKTIMMKDFNAEYIIYETPEDGIARIAVFNI